jgi:serine/threonine-protein kinase RsbW
MQFVEKPLEPFGETLLDLTLPTQISLKTALVFRMVRELAARHCLPAAGDPRAELCFDEAITNAMVHGNKLDIGRKVRVILCADGERWGAIVEDQGDGFKPSDIPNPDDLESALRESGRGILLMDGYLNELLYSKKGNRVLMIRRRGSQPDATEAQLDTTEAQPAVQPRTPVEANAGPVSVLREGDVDVIKVNASRLDEGTTAALDDAVQSTTSLRLLLDLSGVTYMSSLGIRSMVRIHKVVAGRKGRLVVTGLQPPVRSTLNSVKMLSVFAAFPDRQAGLADLRKND